MTTIAERFTFSLDKTARAKIASGRVELPPAQLTKLQKFARDFMKLSTSAAGTGRRYTVARSLHDAASKQVNDLAHELAFSNSGRSLFDCHAEARRRHADLNWILVGTPVPDDEAEVTLAALEDEE